MGTRRSGVTVLTLVMGLLAGACAAELRGSGTATAPSAPRPAWVAGDTWSYSGKTPASAYTYQQTVAGEGVFEGTPAYEVHTGYYQSWMTKDLGLIARLAGGQVVRRVSPPTDWSWPLTVGKSWTRNVTWEDEARGPQRYRYTAVWTVEAYEEVKVPAGNFRAFRVVRHVHGGRAFDEIWYSPEVKWAVKSRGAGAWPPESYEEELTSYKVE
jgi:hypothetical protein